MSPQQVSTETIRRLRTPSGLSDTPRTIPGDALPVIRKLRGPLDLVNDDDALNLSRR